MMIEGVRAMSQIDELQGRITSALDRIGQGLDGMAADGGAGSEEIEALRKELEDEKLVGEQLQERLKALSQKQKDRADAE